VHDASGVLTTGTYELYRPYQVFFDDPLLIGQFAKRDLDNPQRWIVTPAGMKDTLRLSDSIITYEMLTSGTPEDAIKVATWPYWALPPIDTVRALSITNTITLAWQNPTDTHECSYMVSLKGRSGLPIDSLYISTGSLREIQQAFGPCAENFNGTFLRAGTASDPSWEEISKWK
jgi:hypothetical protein